MGTLGTVVLECSAVIFDPMRAKILSRAAQTMADGACLVGEGGRTCGRNLHPGCLGSNGLTGADRAVARRL
jgi:hypothetical protein